MHYVLMVTVAVLVLRGLSDVLTVLVSTTNVLFHTISTTVSALMLLGVVQDTDVLACVLDT